MITTDSSSPTPHEVYGGLSNRRVALTLDIDKWAPGTHVPSLDAALERQIRVGPPFAMQES
jgi:hypothetical protein